MRTTLALMVVLLVLMTGCATTERQTVQMTPSVCGFLGEDTCHNLKPGTTKEDLAALRYANPKAQFTKYNKMMLNVVGFFGSDATKVPPKDQQRMTEMFYKLAHEELATKYQVVDRAGPGVMKVDVAVLDAEAATPGARSVSMVVPQLSVLSTGYSLVAGKYPFAGGGQAAVKLTDAETGQILGAAVDRRTGGGAKQTALQWQWGDAENAIKQWAKDITTTLHAYTSGARKP